MNRKKEGAVVWGGMSLLLVILAGLAVFLWSADTEQEELEDGTLGVKSPTKSVVRRSGRKPLVKEPGMAKETARRGRLELVFLDQDEVPVAGVRAVLQYESGVPAPDLDALPETDRPVFRARDALVALMEDLRARGMLDSEWNLDLLNGDQEQLVSARLNEAEEHMGIKLPGTLRDRLAAIRKIANGTDSANREEADARDHQYYHRTLSAAQKVSSDEGVMTWVLAPGRYVWRKLSPHRVDMRPGREAEKLYSSVSLVENGEEKYGWEVKDPPSRDKSMSDVVEVRAGEVTTIVHRVQRGTLVRGRLPLMDPVPEGEGTATQRSWHQVGIYRKTVMSHPQGEEYNLVLWQQEDSGVVKSGGTFEFKDPPPGDYYVQAWWREGDDVYLCKRLFVLEEGEEEDLGDLVASGGSDAPMTVRLVRDGAVIAPRELFPAMSEPLWCRVNLMLRDPAPEEEDINLIVDFEVGKTVTVHGLRAGEWQLSVRTHPQWPVAPKAVIEPPDHSPVFSVGGGEDVVLEYQVRRSRRRSVTLEVRSSMTPRLYCSILGATEHEGRTADWSWEDGAAQFDFILEPGDYTAIIHTQRATSAKTWKENARVNLCALRRVHIDDDTRKIIMPLEEGNTITGQALDRKGKPLAQELLSFRPVGSSTWVFTTMTDATGRFHLYGIPRGLVLEAQNMIVNDRDTFDSGDRTLRLICR